MKLKLKHRIWFDWDSFRHRGWRLFGYSYISFWNDGDRFHRQLFGPFFLVDAGRCCTTTGARYEDIDPDLTLKP